MYFTTDSKRARERIAKELLAAFETEFGKIKDNVKKDVIREYFIEVFDHGHDAGTNDAETFYERYEDD